jgi:hypothetical protein
MKTLASFALATAILVAGSETNNVTYTFGNPEVNPERLRALMVDFEEWRDRLYNSEFPAALYVLGRTVTTNQSRVRLECPHVTKIAEGIVMVNAIVCPHDPWPHLGGTNWFRQTNYVIGYASKAGTGIPLFTNSTPAVLVDWQTPMKASLPHKVSEAIDQPSPSKGSLTKNL